MEELELHAPAKINLMLKVVGRREDGYHDLKSLMAPLSVRDVLRIGAVSSSEPDGRGTKDDERKRNASGVLAKRSSVVSHSDLLCIKCDNPEIPTDDDSLLARAFHFAADRLNYDGGIRIHLEKEIPVGAGLGGGSSDAAAIIRAVEKLSGKELAKGAYPELAYKVGADVPFFHSLGSRVPLVSRPFGGGPGSNGYQGACVEGIGEIVKPCEIKCPLYVLLANPGISIPTRWVYENLEVDQLTSASVAASVPESFDSLDVLLTYITNDLESVVLTRYPVVAELKSRIQALGADTALMSGSGSTVFGLFSQKNRRDEVLSGLRLQYPAFWIAGAEFFRS